MNKIFTMLEIRFKEMDAIFVYDQKTNKIYIKFLNISDAKTIEKFLLSLNLEISYFLSYNLLYIYESKKKED